MDSAAAVGKRRPGAFSPMPSLPSTQQPASRPQHQHSQSSESDSSGSSQRTAMSSAKHPIYPYQRSGSSAGSSTTSLQNYSRPSISQVVSDTPSRKNSPLNPAVEQTRGHKRNNSQGFFEPSLPTASLAEQNAMSGLTASQIAAQAAMQHQAMGQLMRKRSQTVPAPQSPPETGRLRPAPMQFNRRPSGGNGPQYAAGGNTVAATAASMAYPRNVQLSPGMTTFVESQPIQPPEKDTRSKAERAKMKLFSKPKHIGISSYKDTDKKDKPLPSPGLGKLATPSPFKHSNVSLTSLSDLPLPSSASLYSMANTSTSTLVPGDRQKSEDKDKDKSHRHHFLSRQKNKLKDKMDDHSLNLSSASSNSKPIDPSAPSIYSFAPSSPGPSSTSFSKSVSGLDLRHGGRALREKMREAVPAERRSEDWLPGAGGHSFTGPTANSSSAFDTASINISYGNLQGFGLSNMTTDDAWDFLKAKLLIIFEGEELRIPVEDLNRLVLAHIQRCVQKRSPTTITEDLRDLLQTGFMSIGRSIRDLPDEKLVPRLVGMWLFVFNTLLPYMQAVFLPLDLEFKGQGTIMSSREAAEFWGFPATATSDELEVRRIVLLSYRDNVILPRHDTLKAIFSRLSLESINVGINTPQPPPSPHPGTAVGTIDPKFASFNSQGSTLLDDVSRSRATSNTSAPGDLPIILEPAAVVGMQPDSAQVTETVGRMLQCVSVLASAQSDDEPQRMMEDLTKTLKLNWLGRGRTGRNRKGFVGAKVPRREGGGEGSRL